MEIKKKYVSNFPVLLRKRFYDNLPGFSGYYVSKRGRIYTRRRVGLGRKSKTGIGDSNDKGYWRELTRVTNHKGYYRLVIQDDLHKRHYVQVSRLVALAWVPNPDNKPLYVIGIIILRTTFIRICTGVLSQKIFNNALKMGDITHAN